jgi:PAS domain S-box-containing protein
MSDDDLSAGASETPPRDFRWSVIFRRSSEAIFFLNRHRRLLFVNAAWERLTGLTNAEVRGLSCKRPDPVKPTDPWEEVLAHGLCPPREALQGRPGHARRLIPRAGSTAHWWDVEFFPLSDDKGVLGFLGKIIPVAMEGHANLGPLPERLAGLRESLARRYGIDGLASRVPIMQRVAEQVRLAGQLRVPVLIRGETGTGKQWLARAIHYQGATRAASFVLLDCRHLPAAILDTVLFGEGGLILQAAAGTLYVKEPALLPRDVQARLCSLLADARPLTPNPSPTRGEGSKTGLPPLPSVGEGGRGGEGAPRVIAGCSSDPAVDVRSGRLLEELHCALTPLVIELPPLRQRTADLPWLAERFLARASEEAGARGKTVKGLTADAWTVLHAHSWPGNLRELYRVLVVARDHTPGEWIDTTDLPMYLRLKQTAEPPAATLSLPLDWLLQEAERRLIQLALRKTGGHKAKAAQMLAIWKPRLLRRMEALGLSDPEEAKKKPEADSPGPSSRTP